MSATGVALTYEKRSSNGPVQASVCDRAQAPRPGSGQAAARRPSWSPGVLRRRRCPASVSAGRDQLYLDVYSGRLGALSPAACGCSWRQRSWHRWLSIKGPSRPVPAPPGWSTCCSCSWSCRACISGCRVWTGPAAAVAFFKRSYGDKARDAGATSSASGPRSLFSGLAPCPSLSLGQRSRLPRGGRGTARAMGGGRGAAATARRGEERPAAAGTASTRRGLEPGGRARRHGFPIGERSHRREGAQVAVAIDRGTGGRPLRSTATFDQGPLVAPNLWRPVARPPHSFIAFAHTGGAGAGQTVAGLVSAGAVVHGVDRLALSWRRFRAWVTRPTLPIAIAPWRRGTRGVGLSRPRWGAHSEHLPGDDGQTAEVAELDGQ
jgi:hypothetical protein